MTLPAVDKPKRKYEITRIQARTRRVMELIVLGYNNQEIGKAVGLSAQMVSNIRNSTIVQSQISVIEASRTRQVMDVRTKIRSKAPVMLGVLEDITLDKETPSNVRSANAKDWLDRAGYQAPKIMVNANTKLTAEDLEKLKKNAEDAGIMDVDFEEVLNKDKEAE